MKDGKCEDTYHVLLFKMRLDTPQQYRNVLIDGATGRVRTALEVQTWRQFFNKVERDPMPESGVDNVVFRNGHLECTRDFYRQGQGDFYTLKNFIFRDIWATDPAGGAFDTSGIQDCIIQNVTINDVKR